MKKKQIAAFGLAAALFAGGVVGAAIKGSANNGTTTEEPARLEESISQVKTTLTSLNEDLISLSSATGDELGVRLSEIQRGVEALLVESYYYTNDFEAAKLYQEYTKIGLELGSIFTDDSYTREQLIGAVGEKKLDKIVFEFNRVPIYITRAAYYNGLNNLLNKTDYVKLQRMENFELTNVKSIDYDNLWVNLSSDKFCGEYSHTEAPTRTSAEYVYGQNHDYCAVVQEKDAAVHKVDEYDRLSVAKGKLKHSTSTWLCDIDTCLEHYQVASYNYDNGTFFITNNATGSVFSFTLSNNTLSQIEIESGESHNTTYMLTSITSAEFNKEYERIADHVNNAIAEYNANNTL